MIKLYKRVKHNQFEIQLKNWFLFSQTKFQFRFLE